jgi:hypothetical protein
VAIAAALYASVAVQVPCYLLMPPEISVRILQSCLTPTGGLQSSYLKTILDCLAFLSAKVRGHGIMLQDGGSRVRDPTR